MAYIHTYIYIYHIWNNQCMNLASPQNDVFECNHLYEEYCRVQMRWVVLSGK